jgi:hypothetical protein
MLMALRYSLLLTDTIKVGKDASVILTEGVSKLRDVVMDLDVSFSSVKSPSSLRW